MKRIMALTLLIFAIGSFSSFFVSAKFDEKSDTMTIVRKYMPPNAILVRPENPSNTPPIQFYDFNQDRHNEIIFTYEIKEKEQPSPSQFGAMILSKGPTGWKKVLETQIQGVQLDYSGLKNITGSDTKEYLFGVTIGAAAGSELEIFQWADCALKKIADIPYHQMAFVGEHHQIGIATWLLYIGDSYLVDVLKWNGNSMVYDEKLYAKYYPTIAKYYKEKIANMDAWFYWYSLADAQIKANKLDEAAKSIEKGIALAKIFALQDIVEDFHDLTKKLERKAM